MLLSFHFIEFQKMSEARRNESGANKISAFAEQTEDIFPDYSSKFKRSALLIQLHFNFDNLINKCHVATNKF